jgi:hypothetical protein
MQARLRVGASGIFSHTGRSPEWTLLEDRNTLVLSSERTSHNDYLQIVFLKFW